jgi:hypothetical protein
MTQRYGSKVLALFHESQGASDAGVWGLFVFNFAFYWANDLAFSGPSGLRWVRCVPG